jgi:hypothetical protein
MNNVNLSKNQIALLKKVYKPFNEKYNITLNEFTEKMVGLKAESLKHKDFYNLINKVNKSYDYWSDPSIFKPSKINFKNLRYILQEETDDYIIGIQEHIDIKRKMKIISFKNLMLLDYDQINLQELEDILSKFPFTFLIYQTFNGFHAYNISKVFDYTKQETLQLMYDMKCDKHYINFVRYTGFVLRLEKKVGRKEEYIEKFVKQINTFPILDHLKKLVEFKDNFFKKS